MSKGMIGCGVALLVLLAILGGVFMWFVGVRNGLVEAEESVKAQWSQVENVYQRRLDLVPNLVATVKGYAEHEQETFTEVTEARSKASSIQVDPCISSVSGMTSATGGATRTADAVGPSFNVTCSPQPAITETKTARAIDASTRQ